MKYRRRGQFDVALLAQFARKCCKQRFALLNSAAWQMPTGNIGVLNEKDPALAVQNQPAHAKREAA